MRMANMAALAVGLLLTAGCESGVNVEDVAGQVTFAGQPVKYGTIQFIPASTDEEPGPAGRAEIIDGRFDTAVSGSGIVAGPMKVRITGYESKSEEVTEDGTNSGKSTPPLFSGYTIETDVAGPTQDFEVPESAKGFDIFKAGGGRPRGPVP